MKIKILITCMLAIGAAWSGETVFFGPNGDLNHHKEELQESRLCRRYDCHLYKDIFLQLEHEIHIAELSDQEIIEQFVSHIPQKLSKRKKKKSFELAQQIGVIDTVQLSILRNALSSDKATHLLEDYLKKLKNIKGDLDIEKDAFSTLNEKRIRKKIEGLKEFSARARLYNLYSPIQIKFLAKTFKDALAVMTSERAVIQIDYENNGEWDRQEDLSAQERYRLGLKLLMRDYERLKISPLFISKNDLQFIDLLTAALETSVIDKATLEQILSINELKIIKENFWQRHRNTFFSLAKAGLLTIPTTGPIILVAITLTEAFTTGKNRHATDSVDHLF